MAPPAYIEVEATLEPLGTGNSDEAHLGPILGPLFDYDWNSLISICFRNYVYSSVVQNSVPRYTFGKLRVSAILSLYSGYFNLNSVYFLL